MPASLMIFCICSSGAFVTVAGFSSDEPSISKPIETSRSFTHHIASM